MRNRANGKAATCCAIYTRKLPVAPHAAGVSRLRLEREHGAYRGRVLPPHGERARCGTRRTAQQCTGRARDAGVVEQ